MTDRPDRGDLELLRAFEPVVRFTKGEFFYPVSASRYVERAALWGDDREGESHCCFDVGQLTPQALTEHAVGRQGHGHALSAVDTETQTRASARIPPKERPPAVQGASRLASVGVTARLVDALNRLSLLFRGSVPGGSAARSFLVQRDHLEPERPTYYGRVVHDGPWIVAQYWYFYSFNNWRSGFGGVNEHEGDWEQVTIFLDGDGRPGPSGWPAPRWVVFSAHDETGDDLRRRWDDPDLTLVQERHPVVFAGAGSHSGAYLPGDYLITVQPPTLPAFVRAAGRAARIFTPWSVTARSGGGVAIPYVDYARGDGRGVGPGEGEDWFPVEIEESQQWVWGYRGLWGHDTGDRLGGERGPAGPRYERDGTVRQSWADPVGWSGLAKVAPNADREQELVELRADQLRAQLDDIAREVRGIRTSLRAQAAGLEPRSPEVLNLKSEEQRSVELRMEQTALKDELSRMERVCADGVDTADPHDHLSHRRLPMEPMSGIRGRLLAGWSVLSTPLMLCAIAAIISPVFGLSSTLFAVYSVVILLSVEGLLRGHFVAVALRFVAAAVVLGVLYLASLEVQAVIAVPLLVAAAVVLVVNLREALRR